MPVDWSVLGIPKTVRRSTAHRPFARACANRRAPRAPKKVSRARSTLREGTRVQVSRTKILDKTKAENDAVITEKERNELPTGKNHRNEFASAKSESSHSQPHQRSDDVAGPDTLRQEAESNPDKNEATDGNGENSKLERNDDKDDSENSGGGYYRARNIK